MGMVLLDSFSLRLVSICCVSLPIASVDIYNDIEDRLDCLWLRRPLYRPSIPGIRYSYIFGPSQNSLDVRF